MRIDNFRVRDISRIISETRFMPSSRRRFFFFQSTLNLSWCLFPFRLDWLRYFAGGICILIEKVNKFCWFRFVSVLYYCVESNITMQPTPYFPRLILTIIKVSETNTSFTLRRWSASALRCICRSCPNLKEFKWIGERLEQQVAGNFTDSDKNCIERTVISKGDWKNQTQFSQGAIVLVRNLESLGLVTKKYENMQSYQGEEEK